MLSKLIDCLSRKETNGRLSGYGLAKGGLIAVAVTALVVTLTGIRQPVPSSRPVDQTASGGVAIAQDSAAGVWAQHNSEPATSATATSFEKVYRDAEALVSQFTESIRDLAFDWFGIGESDDVGGQTLPSPYYLTDDVQYFPAGPEFKLSNEAAALKKARQAQQLGRDAAFTPAEGGIESAPKRPF